MTTSLSAEKLSRFYFKIKPYLRKDLSLFLQPYDTGKGWLVIAEKNSLWTADRIEDWAIETITDAAAESLARIINAAFSRAEQLRAGKA